MKKLKNGSHSAKTHHTENFQLTTSQKVGLMLFLSVSGIGKITLTIMKLWGNGSHFVETCHTENFQLMTPPPQKKNWLDRNQKCLPL